MFLDSVAVQQQTQTAGMVLIPFLVRHFLAIRSQPEDVLDVGALDVSPLEEMAPTEHRVIFSQANDPADELQQLLIVTVHVPVDPADLIVLAVGVVVAVLGAPHFVPGQQHRHTLRQQQRGEEIALLLCASIDDIQVLGAGPS